MEIVEGLLDGVEVGHIEVIILRLHFEFDDGDVPSSEGHQSVLLNAPRHVQYLAEMLLHFVQSGKLHLAFVDVEALLVQAQVVLPQQVQVEVRTQVPVVLVDLLVGTVDHSHRCDDQQAY